MSDTAAMLRNGDLGQLRATFADRVRTQPTRPEHRLDLADVLILQGELERADAQLDLAAAQDTTLAVPVALTRQLIRAATMREETWSARRPPELVVEADVALTAALSRLAGKIDAPPETDLEGILDGRPFSGLRDADDRMAGILEVLTSTGKSVWISLGQIASLTVQAPTRVRDLVWRQAELEVRNGPTGVVYLPAIYPAPASDQQRLGRETDWHEQEGSMLGIGLRTFLIGDDAVTLNDFSVLQVTG